MTASDTDAASSLVPTSDDTSSRNGRSRDAAEAERDVEAAPILVERDLRRGRDKGKIRAPRADLEEADADAARAARPETGSR